MPRHRPIAIAIAVMAAVLAGCGSDGRGAEPATTLPSTSTVIATTTSTSTTSTTSTTGKPAASSTSTRPAPVAAPPPPSDFTATTSNVTAAELPYSWREGCPVGPAQLRRLRVSYWDFAGARRDGDVVVNASVAPAIVKVFERLYVARFPIRRLEPIDVYHGSDDESLAADNTAAFNCRNAVASGPPRWSAHAYGLAIDVNPVENPYIEGGRVHPPAGAAYRDRSRYRPGMAVSGGILVNAFASIGWGWGGRWSTPDYQHFSSTGN
jgi:hypothetical protein